MGQGEVLVYELQTFGDEEDTAARLLRLVGVPRGASPYLRLEFEVAGDAVRAEGAFVFYGKNNPEVERLSKSLHQWFENAPETPVWGGQLEEEVVSFIGQEPSLAIKHVLDYKNVVQARLSDVAGINTSTVSLLCNGKATVTPEIALKLEAFSGVSAEVWLAIQSKWTLKFLRDNKFAEKADG